MTDPAMRFAEEVIQLRAEVERLTKERDALDTSDSEWRQEAWRVKAEVAKLEEEREVLREHVKAHAMHARSLSDALVLTGAEVESLRAERERCWMSAVKFCPWCEGGGLQDDGETNCDVCSGSGSWCDALAKVARETLDFLKHSEYKNTAFRHDLEALAVAKDSDEEYDYETQLALADGSGNPGLVGMVAKDSDIPQMCPTCGQSADNPEIMGGICTNDFHTQPSDTEKRP